MSAEASTAPKAVAWRPYQIYLVVLLVLVSISSYMDRGIMGLLQEVIKRELSLSDLEIGLLSGPAFALFHSFVGLPVARVAERVERPKLLAGMVVVWSLMTAACASAGSFLTLGLFRAGVGMGEGGANPISHALVADSFTVKQRGLAMSILSSGASIGGILAPLIGGYVAHRYGWRAAFVAVGLPGLALAVLCWFLKESRPEGAGKAAVHRPFMQDLRWLFVNNKSFRYIFLGGAFNGIAIQGIGIFTVSFVMRTHGLNVAEAGGVLSLRGVMGLAGTVVGGYIADKFADKRGRAYVLVCAAGALLSFLIFMVAFNASAWPLVLGCLLGGVMATELKAGPNFAAIQNVVPSTLRSTAVAIFFLGATVVGTGGGGALVGWMSDLFAAHAFPAALGDYVAACPVGHKAAHAMVGPLAQACAAASTEGLRLAMMAISVSFLGALTCFYLASRDIDYNRD